MVVEHFHQGCLEKVYDRFHAKGRMLPEGLIYIDSWLSADEYLLSAYGIGELSSVSAMDRKLERSGAV